MSLNETVSGERVHIGFFGKRNVGKSSLVNAITGQSVSVVSDVGGTTTDPVRKAMELLPIGPVLILDTPGFDDEGALGDLRVQKTKEILARTDIAVLVTDAARETDEDERRFLTLLDERKIPYLLVHNKADMFTQIPAPKDREIWVSAKESLNIEALKTLLGTLAKENKQEKRLVSDLLQAGDHVVLVTPIDVSAPKGRLILPQQQTLRDILDAHCTASVCQTEELAALLDNLKRPPRMVITDSQVFERVASIVPKEIPLTSFSILFARYKGDLGALIEGAKRLSELADGDRVLISEGCTHHRQCGDIGTQKLPAWISKFTGVTPTFSFTSGGEFPDDTSDYRLIVHCGGCMLNEAEMKRRIAAARDSGVPIVNYGVAIAHMKGVLERSLRVLEEPRE